MKHFIIFVFVFAGGMLAGYFLIGNHAGLMSPEEVSTSAEKEPLYWVAPMDKNYRRDGPGKSPMGMDLVPVYEEDASAGDDNSIRISPVVENNLGVRVAPVTREKLLIPVNTIGTVQFDESRIRHIHSRVEGWIERLGVAASGDKVSKGQTLFELYSPVLVNAQEEYLAARRSGNKNLIKASTSRLYALGLTSAQVDTLARRGRVENTISVLAEQDGIVIDLNVRKGMYIQPRTEVLSLGSLDSVWILGEVFERQAYLVQQGQTVEAALGAMPGMRWQGMVNYIYPQLEAKTRTLPVRIRLLNQDHRLKPGMLVNLRILSEVEQSQLSVPRQALIKAGKHQRVVKSLGDGRYQSVPVEAGLEGELPGDAMSTLANLRRVQILQGLDEGDQVVTSAQFLIDSESNIEAELQRMEVPVETEAKASTQSDNRVITSGIVHKTMPSMGLVSISHDPIPEWDWPTMKMDFPIAENLTLSDFKPGETIRFELEKTGDWDYLITALGDDIAMDHASTMGNSKSLPKGAVETSGKIEMLMLDMQMLEVSHAPIPEWDWPQMRMMFRIPEGEPVPELQVGDEVVFALKSGANGDYEIFNIEQKQ
ncbi:MAG: efflux transporter periplasmic adaptor subunit [Oleiphilus sp.]|nr:MAG: efflux transporter periplasmic adaptor subunit [Oleiphilus sp.]